MDFDAVIIGAGHNGLAAAVHLASRGWSVGVFERNEAAGWRGAHRGGHASRLPPRSLCQECRLLAVALASTARSFCSAPASAEHLVRHRRRQRLVRDPATSHYSARARFPHADAKAWAAMFEKFGADAPHIFGLLGSPMTARALAAYAWKAWRAKGTDWIMETSGCSVSSPREFLDRNFESPEIRERSGRGACTSISRPTCRVARSSPTSKAWRTRRSAW